MATAPSTLFDSFSRSVTNSWGTSDSGHAWVGTNSNYDSYSSTGYGRIYVTASQAQNVAYVDVPSNSSQEVLVKVKWNVDSLTDHGPVLRREDSDNYYYVSIQDYYDEVAIRARVSGINYEIGRATGVSFSKDTYYWVRFRADASGLYVRIWADGVVEPGTWTLETGFYTGSNPPGAGDFGYYTQGTSSTYSVYLDTVYWYSLEETELGLPVTETFTRNVDKGWGWSDTGHQWEGSLVDDPNYYTLQGEGDVSSSGYARLETIHSSTSRTGMIGPVVADSDVLSAVYVNSTSGSPEIDVGIRGAIQSPSGSVQWVGYYGRIIAGSTAFTLRVVTTFGGTSSQLDTYTLSAAPGAGEKWWVRIQATGTTIRCRAWEDGGAEPGTWQNSVTNSTHTSGRSFIRFVGDASFDHNFRVYDLQHTVISTGDELTTGTLSTSSVTDTSFAITATYTGDSNTNSTCVIQYKEVGTDTWTSPTVTTNRGSTNFTASATGLTQGTVYDVKATYSDANGVTGTNPKTTTVTTSLKGIDSGTLSLTADATNVYVTMTYTNDSDDDSAAALAWNLIGGVSGYSGLGAMTADRPNKRFTYTYSGLANDTTYYMRVVLTDSDGVRGTDTHYSSITTLGQGVQFADTPITATPKDVSATITVYYELDTNDNSSITLQYKSIRDSIWTTINSGAITTVRGSKLFRAQLTNLIPNLSYQVQVTLADPNGVVSGTESVATTVFTTTGEISDPDLRGKHYVYKVYTEDDAYLGTWHDAPEPQFQWHENGGVSDLTVNLPRSVSSINADVTIDFGHRVDIWAIDGTSEGMGVNLLKDWDTSLESWTLDTSWTYSATGGPDDTQALKFFSAATTQRTVLSETLTLSAIVPVVVKMVAKARGGKIRMDIAAYDVGDVLLEASDDNAETVGTGWQNLKLEWTPPPDTSYIRVRVSNIGAGTMYFDKITVLQKEVLIYRGRIESYTTKVRQSGEELEIEILGVGSQLTDTYIRFLQYATTQPAQDSRLKEHPNENLPPADPANIMKELIRLARIENPRLDIYYDDDISSIKLTGNTVQYTFRDQQLLNCFDRVRTLCPPGWHWYLDPDGLVHLRGPEHVETHKLRLNVEVLEFENERTIRNMKNYIVVKGRQDSDTSEADGFGTIEHHASDPTSIARYGLRFLFFRDSNIKDPDTAEIVAEGRLEEYNVIEEAGRAVVPDEKDIQYAGGALRGANIEAFRPGDFVTIKDPVSGGQRTYWNQFNWDAVGWDDDDNRVLPTEVPIKTIQYHGNEVLLELSERQPSATGDFAKLARWLRLQDQGDETA